ncbi:reverse transcriptase domain-containing protein [Tanacetum coccineum]
MPFGLKNVGATYQRFVDTIFEGQMGQNLEAYVDDMVIKSKTRPKMIKDVEETLLTLKKVNMKLNPQKCSFRMVEGKFLGYIVTFEAIEQIRKKQRFLFKAAERALPCLDTLRKCTNKKDFYLTTEAEEAFQAMKKLIVELPTLTAPKKKEELMVYLSVANEAISVVLLVERGERQAPVHYEATGRLAKWGIELEAYGIKYAPRSMIKGQVLADFLADTMGEDNPAQVKTKEPNKILVEGESMEEQEVLETKAPKNLRTEEDIWKMYTDGASNEHGSGVDSKLVASQVEGSYEAKGLKTKKYKEKALEMIRSFNNFQISRIPREENRKADALSSRQAKYLINEIYMGSCGMHDGPRREVHKAMNAEYFWPSMLRDANNEISSCDSCQVYATIPKMPKNDMISVTLAWPF